MSSRLVIVLDHDRYEVSTIGMFDFYEGLNTALSVLSNI